jgi:hypothetical protein
MKTLYESILDDEDVLIDDVKKLVNDPIISLYRIFLKNKTLENNREANNIIQELKEIFKLEESRIELTEFGGHYEIHFNNPKKYTKRWGGDMPGPGSVLLSISFMREINAYALQKCNLKKKKSIAAIDNFIETHNLTIGNNARYFNPQKYYKKL